MNAVLRRLVAVACLAACVGGCGYSEVVHSWFDHSADSGAQSSQKLPGHVYLLRGLAGDIYSLGLDQLADKINRRGVTATVHGMTESGALAADIIRKHRSDEDRGPIMLLGHSSGGDHIMEMAEKLKAADIPVALAFGLDPTRLIDAVPSNVDVFINLYQSTNPIGGGEVKPGSGFRGRLIDVDLRKHTEIVHITLDKTPEVQDLVAAKIVALAAYAARQGGVPGLKQQHGGSLRPLVLKYVVPGDAPIELWDGAIEVKAKSGDTVDSIASANGVPGWAIAQINAIEPDRPIEAGRKLIIPRSFYTDAPVPAPETPTALRSPVRAAARLTATRPVPQNQRATENPAAATGGPAPQNSNSFGDRWGAAPAQ